MSHAMQRRDFLKATAVIAGANLWSSGARAESPNGKLRTAHIGVGGMGGADLHAIASHPNVEIGALCDVDLTCLNSAKAKFPNAETFRDYREMFAKLSDPIDAVVVSTPDHSHAPAAMTALNHNKPVYCQKPLTHDVFESRQLRKTAEAKKLPTQMGIQVHSSATYRRAVKMIQSGVIGKISEVHAWSTKNWGYNGSLRDGEYKAPATLDWNLWIGTAAMRPFVPDIYHPAQWRKLIDFGTGTLGDMGVHIFDTPYAALELTFPLWAKTSCRPPTGIGHPEKNMVHYEFPGTRYTTDTLQWTWYDGAFAPPRNDALNLPKELKLPSQGSLFVGEEGSLLLPHVSEGQLIPEEKFRDYKRPDVPGGNHYHEWVDACLGKGTTSASFSYGGPLTEALLLGVVAARFPDTKLNWDADKLEVTNITEANELLRRVYREGFTVMGLSQ